MNEATKRFINSLEDDIARWEERVAFLEDRHVSIEDMNGKPIDKTQEAARFRALAAEYRELLGKLTR